MKEAGCSCATFGKLAGASVSAYVAAFLEELKNPASAAIKRYRCRVCGCLWEKQAPESKSVSTRPTLVRLGSMS